MLIQIRHVPETLHRTLKARAALAGLSLSDYVLGELQHSAERPSAAELRAKLASRAPVYPDVPPARAVREERDRR